MKQVLKPFYNYFEKKAKSPYALYVLALLAFVESIFFPFPNEILLIPMCLFLPKKIYKICFVVSLFSVLGGVAGYFIGYLCFDTIGMELIEFFHLQNYLSSFTNLYEEYGYSVVFLGGFTPFVPYKLIVLFSGFIKSNFIVFLIASSLSRFARYFLIGWLLKRYGESAKHFIEKKLDLIFLIICIILIILMIVVG